MTSHRDDATHPEKPATPGLTRRELLGAGLTLSLGGLFMPETLLSSVASAPAPGKASSLPYQVVGWGGDEFAMAHKFRDGLLPQLAQPSEKVDVVVVGGGISGLGAAYKLRDMKVLVLEGGARLGGNAQESTWNGLKFNMGSAYFVDGEGPQGEFMQEIGYPLKPMREPVDSWRIGDRWVRAPFDDETIAAQPTDLRNALTGLKKALVEVNEGDDYPESDYTQASAKALAMDKITFEEWLKPWAHPEIMKFINAYCNSSMGASSSTISAYGGVNFYTEVVGHLYSVDRGNALIVDLLRLAIEKAGANRIRTDSFVFRIEPRGSGAVVHYLSQGRPAAVECRKVVMAVPFYFAARLMPGLSPDQRYALSAHEYSSYVTAGLCFKQKIACDCYDSWVAAPGHFEDFIAMGWTQDDQLNLGKGQVITCFAPCRAHHVGRQRLMTLTPEQWAPAIVSHFESLYPGSTQHLEQVVLNRYGHAMLVNKVGMFTEWLPNLKKTLGPVHLCHSDGLALPAVESCLPEILRTAKEIRDGWGKP